MVRVETVLKATHAPNHILEVAIPRKHEQRSVRPPFRHWVHGIERLVVVFRWYFVYSCLLPSKLGLDVRKGGRVAILLMRKAQYGVEANLRECKRVWLVRSFKR